VGRSGASLVFDFSALSVDVDSLWILMSSTRLSTPKSVNALASSLRPGLVGVLSTSNLLDILKAARLRARSEHLNRPSDATMLIADPTRGSSVMPKMNTLVRNPWTKEDVRELKAHSKARTPVPAVAKAMKRTEGAVRQKAKTIVIGLGHRR
jgi:hypothetical protein